MAAIKGHTAVSLGDNKTPNVLTGSFQTKLMVQEVVSHHQVFPHFDIRPDGLFVKDVVQSFLELVYWCSEVLHNGEESRSSF